MSFLKSYKKHTKLLPSKISKDPFWLNCCFERGLDLTGYPSDVAYKCDYLQCSSKRNEKKTCFPKNKISVLPVQCWCSVGAVLVQCWCRVGGTSLVHCIVTAVMPRSGAQVSSLGYLGSPGSPGSPGSLGSQGSLGYPGSLGSP